MRRSTALLGVLVALFWGVWPFVYFGVAYVVAISKSTSRGCSIEGCNKPFTMADLAWLVIPPVIVTALWWRRRRRDS